MNLKIFSLLLLFSLAFSFEIKVNVNENFNFFIPFFECKENKNFLECKASIYNSGSLNFSSFLFINSSCCKIFSEVKKLNSSEEKNLEIAYLFLENESLEVYAKIYNVTIFLKNINKTIEDFLEEKEIDLDYIYENGKLKILGNLNHYFYILNSTTNQKLLKGIYNEIEIENKEKVKIVFFNENSYFLKEFPLEKPSLFKKVYFEIKKFFLVIFSKVLIFLT